MRPAPAEAEDPFSDPPSSTIPSTLAEAFRVNEPCWADIDLAYRWRVWWLSVGAAYGDPYQLYDAERNPATYLNR